MDRDAIKEVLREVLGPNTELVDHPHWVGLRCPFAPWKHASGRDSSPSAGVSVKDGDTSIFNCYTCGTRGSLPTILKRLETYTGESYKALRTEIEDGEFLGGKLPEWGASVKQSTKLRPLGPEYLDLYDSAKGHWYLKKRGINDRTVELLDLQVDPEDSQMEERIIFPVFDRQRNLYGFSGRATSKTAELKVRDYHGLAKAKLLLGEQLIEASDPYVVVVEGLFDVAKMVQYGYPVVGTMHAGLTEYQRARLLDIGKVVVLMFDNDEAGERATEDVAKALAGKIPVQAVRYKMGKQKIAAKDPCTCTAEEVEWMIQHAKIL